MLIFRDDEVHDLVNQTLKIEMKKIEVDVDYKAKTEKVARAFITRFECEEREDDRIRVVFSLGAYRVFFFSYSLHIVLQLYTSGGV
jgi:hypothetical protein